MNNRYFADEYRKSSMYWSSLCDVMSANDGPTQQVSTLSRCGCVSFVIRFC